MLIFSFNIPLPENTINKKEAASKDETASFFIHDKENLLSPQIIRILPRANQLTYTCLN
jgi:hypothetical protein